MESIVTMVRQSVELLPARASSSSAVNVKKEEYPLKYGNYFDFPRGVRCLNMWLENMLEIGRRQEVTHIRCTVYEYGYGRMAFVTDPQIPAEWLHGGICTTGTGNLPREFIEALCAHQGVAPVDRICGCEKPDQAPEIRETWRLKGEGVKTLKCALCGRSWELSFNASTR